ncbi:WD40 repeat-like protein [Choiromyces venosus 120613-1]|uniref:WD40 repeat-like protein n=1 Tax=Choiromyces venosus 120613-1 TaxID=1336337 RepID=A0A3N4K508_9PEZI|nr:WD40 repeat-like protein [Choiromyces venosus 120613-1]
MPPRTFCQTTVSNLSTPAGTYIYALTPLSATHLAASTSDSSIITFSKPTLTLTTTISHAHTNVTSLTPYPSSPQTLLTSGTDGLVKLWDLRCPPTASLASEIAVGAPVLCASANAQGGIIAGTEMQERVSKVYVWDGRMLSGEDVKPTWVFAESHGDDVSFVGFAGEEEEAGGGGSRWGVSGGMDGLVSVFDLRAGKAGAGDDDEKALWQVVNVGASVHRAGFLDAGAGGKGEWVFGLSTDESLVLGCFDRTPGREEEEEGDVQGGVAGDVGDVRERLGCEYVVDVLRASGNGTTGGIVVAGNKEVGKQWVDLVPLRWAGSQWGFASEDKVRLQGGHGEEVCRGIWVDEESETVFTGGEDGLVKVWREETSREEGVSEGEKKERKEGRRERRRREKERFKPY